MMSTVQINYLPCTAWFYETIGRQEIFYDPLEIFKPQSYRNRCTILTANGKLDLIIPVRKSAPHTPMKDIVIAYEEKWQMRHWRAITSAYGKSPFFEYYEDDLRPFYEFREPSLLTLNLSLLQTIAGLLKWKVRIREQEMTAAQMPLSALHPKIPLNEAQSTYVSRRYYQTFENKYGFTPNMSVLDLLCNEGPMAMEWLSIPN